MWKNHVWMFILAAAPHLLSPLPVKAESSAPRLMFQFPRLALSAEWVGIDKIPEAVRTVSEYNRSSLTHELPPSTGGSIVVFSLGAGMTLVDRVTIAYDVSWFDSYNGGRTTWSEIGFPSDDYLGYRYHGTYSDLSLNILLLSFGGQAAEGNYGIYAKGGERFYNATLASGSDAWSEFNTQHSVIVNGQSYFLGVGIKIYRYFSFEYQRTDASNQTPRVQSNSLNLRANFEF